MDMINTETAIRNILPRSKVKVIFATIVGMDIARYNKAIQSQDLLSKQIILNDSIKAVNNRLILRNTNKDVATPWLHRMVHSNKKGKSINSYHLLTPDGCHLMDYLIDGGPKNCR